MAEIIDGMQQSATNESPSKWEYCARGGGPWVTPREVCAAVVSGILVGSRNIVPTGQIAHISEVLQSLPNNCLEVACGARFRKLQAAI
jgi:hypothetical protein